MQIIRNSSPQEAVLSWLQAELNSKRFQIDLRASLKKFNAPQSLIIVPNLDDQQENALRYKILKEYRNWFNDDMDSYDWSVIDLYLSDVEQLEYIDYSYWNELSDNTHKVKPAANNIRGGKVVFDVPNDNYWLVAKEMELGKYFAPIIILKDGTNLSSKIVEGHVRATGYALADKPPKALRAIQGIMRG